MRYSVIVQWSKRGTSSMWKYSVSYPLNRSICHMPSSWPTFVHTSTRHGLFPSYICTTTLCIPSERA